MIKVLEPLIKLESTQGDKRIKKALQKYVTTKMRFVLFVVKMKTYDPVMPLHHI